LLRAARSGDENPSSASHRWEAPLHPLAGLLDQLVRQAVHDREPPIAGLIERASGSPRGLLPGRMGLGGRVRCWEKRARLGGARPDLIESQNACGNGAPRPSGAARARTLLMSRKTEALRGAAAASYGLITLETSDPFLDLLYAKRLRKNVLPIALWAQGAWYERWGPR
jgi:hypothetical protein